MKASEAYEQTVNRINKHSIDKHINFLDTLIKEGTNKGFFHISLPSVIVNDSDDLFERIKKHYLDEGYLLEDRFDRVILSWRKPQA